MAWVIVFILSWVILLVFVDASMLKRTAWGGVSTFFMAMLVDWFAIQRNLYQFYDVILPVLGNPLPYLTGPVFTMGVLFFQCTSRRFIVQAANIAVFSAAYLAVEYLIVLSGSAAYLNWHPGASLFVDVMAFSALSFAGQRVVLGTGGGEAVKR